MGCIVRGQAYYNGMNIPMLASVGASEEAHDVRDMNFIAEKSGQHSSGMNGRDCCLFFPEGVIVCNPGKVTGIITLNKHLGKMGHKGVGIAVA